MRNYRLYRLDGGGKISSAEWIDADSDEEALARVRDAEHPFGFELWERERLVGSGPQAAG